MMELQQDEILASTVTFEPQLTLFSRDDDRTLLVSGCGTESEEEETMQSLGPSTPSELAGVTGEDENAAAAGETVDDTWIQVEDDRWAELKMETDFIRLDVVQA